MNSTPPVLKIELSPGGSGRIAICGTRPNCGGHGSTVNKFIDALATIKDQIPGAVSSSVASTERLRAYGIAVFDNEVGELAAWIVPTKSTRKATWS